MQLTVNGIDVSINEAAIAQLVRERLTADTMQISAQPMLPAIGEPYQGGQYAGLTLVDNVPQILVLLPGELIKGEWKDAADWAKQNGGELPSRFDGLALFKNLKSEFKEEAYWLNEQHASVSGYAW